MVDFRTRFEFPIEAFLQASRRPSKYAGLSAAVQGLERGFTKGIQLSESIRAIKEKRARSQAIADFVAPQKRLIQPQEEKQGPPQLVQGHSKADRIDELTGLPFGTTAQIAKEGGIKSVIPLIEASIKPVKPPSKGNPLTAIKAEFLNDFRKLTRKYGGKKGKAEFEKKFGFDPTKLLGGKFDFLEQIFKAGNIAIPGINQ